MAGRNGFAGQTYIDMIGSWPPPRVELARVNILLLSLRWGSRFCCQYGFCLRRHVAFCHFRKGWVVIIPASEIAFTPRYCVAEVRFETVRLLSFDECSLMC